MFEYTLENTDGSARAGSFVTEHGTFQTPVFMPVWTKASVKWIENDELDTMWAEIILANTYHLYLRPGKDIVKHFGWVHKFQNYNKPILTDSGGFQVFSLGKGKNGESLVKITEDGAYFKSHIDGSKHYFDSENIMDIQSELGADIIMAWDECAPWDSSHSYATDAMNRTHRWATRCVKRWKHNNALRQKEGTYIQALFPIVQWVMYDDLRKQSAEFIWNLDCPWIAIGGLSVGESKADMYRTLDTLEPVLPKHKPRYLMGVWTPEDLIEAIHRWIDMFDCVLPTRLGRHGRVFSYSGDINIKNAKFKLDEAPIDDKCRCKVCKNYSRWYLRHLITENELQGMSLLSYHNLHFLINLTKDARAAILENRFAEFRDDFWKKYPKDVLKK